MYVRKESMKENIKNWIKDFLNCCVLFVIAIIVYKIGGFVKNDVLQIAMTVALTAYAATIQKKHS